MSPPKALHIEAGFLRLGERVVEKVRDVVERDRVRRYLAVSTSLDGTYGMPAACWPVRFSTKRYATLSGSAISLLVGVKIELERSPFAGGDRSDRSRSKNVAPGRNVMTKPSPIPRFGRYV